MNSLFSIGRCRGGFLSIYLLNYLFKNTILGWCCSDQGNGDAQIPEILRDLSDYQPENMYDAVRKFIRVLHLKYTRIDIVNYMHIAFMHIKTCSWIGIHRNPGYCESRDAMGCNICNLPTGSGTSKDVKYTYLVVENMDDDYLTRNWGPLAVRVSKYIHCIAPYIH